MDTANKDVSDHESSILRQARFTKRALVSFGEECNSLQSHPGNLLAQAETLRCEFDSLTCQVNQILDKLASVDNEQIAGEYHESLVILLRDARYKYHDLILPVLSPLPRSSSPSECGAPIEVKNPSYELHKQRLSDVPVFDGDVTKFQTFLASFEHAIDISLNLPEVRKLSALCSKLSGDPLRLMNYYGASTDDFKTAYDTLKSNYSGPRRVLEGIVSKLWNIQPLVHDTSGGFDWFYSEVSSLFRALKNIETDDPLDYVMLSHFMSKLPIKVQHEFYRELDPNEVPKVSDLLSFLKVQSDIKRSQHSAAVSPTNPTSSLQRNAILNFKSHQRSSSPNMRKFPQNRTPSSTNSSSVHQPTFSNLKCHLCGDSHFLYRCSQFKSLKIHERRNFIIKRGLCEVCFSNTHKTTHCKSLKACLNCPDRHHTYLHVHSTLTVPEHPNLEPPQSASSWMPNTDPDLLLDDDHLSSKSFSTITSIQNLPCHSCTSCNNPTSPSS